MPEDKITNQDGGKSTTQDSVKDNPNNLSVEARLEAATQLLSDANQKNEKMDARIKELEVALAKVSLKVDVSADEDKAFLAFDKYK